MPTDALEYEEEEDVFGSDDDINPTPAIATPGAYLLNVNPAEPIRSQPASTTSANLSAKRAEPRAQVQAGASSSSGSAAGYTGNGTTSSWNQNPTKKGKEKASAQAQPASTGRVYKDVEGRLRELQESRRSGREVYDNSTGVRSLKGLTMAVIKINALRIWDIGDLEYPLIKPFIDDLPMEQLAEIEANSQHIKKDTDWLWEIFLLQEFPLFHERCQDRRGEPRTSGWRKMYKKAKEDQIQRQSQAIDRVAARYKQLEEEKAAKRIVVMDKIMPDKRPAAKSGWGRSRFGSSTSSSGSHVSKSQNPIAKARLEAQRARVALTHASGRYIPPQPARNKQKSETALYKNPYLPGGGASAATGPGYTPMSHAISPIDGPRLPPPRRSQNQNSNRASQAGGRSRSSPSPSSPASDLIPGSYPTSHGHNQGQGQVRSSLPAHLATRAASTSAAEQKMKAEERFRIDGNRSKFKEIKRVEKPKFEVPKLDKDPTEQRGRVMDFFAAPAVAVAAAAANAISVSASSPTGAKRANGAAAKDGQVRIGEKRKTAGGSGTEVEGPGHGAKRMAFASDKDHDHSHGNERDHFRPESGSAKRSRSSPTPADLNLHKTTTVNKSSVSASSSESTRVRSATNPSSTAISTPIPSVHRDVIVKADPDANIDLDVKPTLAAGQGYRAKPIPASISTDESNRLNSVLFRKKKGAKGK